MSRPAMRRARFPKKQELLFSFRDAHAEQLVH
jgi:hypothetical protein